MRRVLAQARVEVTLTLRRGETLLVTMIIPVGILLFFSVVDVLPHTTRQAVDFLVPGVLALALISTGMVSLGIATGFERQAGVLRRLGVTPLGRAGLLAAKTSSVVLIEILQWAAIFACALALGWRPAFASPAAVGGLWLLGTAAFAGIGFTLAGRLRAEANLGVANGLFLGLLLLGGIIVPVSRLPGPLRALTRALPAEPLATSLRTVLEGGAPEGRALVVLGAWAAGACALAALTFRWD